MHDPSSSGSSQPQQDDDKEKASQEDLMEQVAEMIDNLSSYQLYRLQTRINFLLEDPQRLKVVARSITPRCEIQYFCVRDNRCKNAIVEKINRTTVDVIDVEGGERWRIELAAINTGDATVRPLAVSGRLSKQDFSVGQIVGFENRDLEEVIGTIIRLNSKTATLECDLGFKWRVAYSLLRQIFDANSSPASSASHSEDKSKQQLLLE